ncbi:hypothetical protein KAI04_00990 [Candidatus Pacearchaeota archaeon]|nr:hypothetical protein [Candidatus Pacearchaeota archaeon]
MSLEGELSKDSNSKDFFDKRDYLLITLFFAASGTIAYFGCKLFQDFVEYLSPYLDSNKYIPF